MSSKLPLLFKRLDAAAVIPARGNEYAAGYDLNALADGHVPAGEQRRIATGISVALPPGTYGRIAARSGQAYKYLVATNAGVIDEDYRGEIGILLLNHHASEPFVWAAGDRVAQMVVEYVVPTDPREVDELPPSSRGVGGFGSTGISAVAKPPTFFEVTEEAYDTDTPKIVLDDPHVEIKTPEVVRSFDSDFQSTTTDALRSYTGPSNSPRPECGVCSEDNCEDIGECDGRGHRRAPCHQCGRPVNCCPCTRWLCGCLTSGACDMHSLDCRNNNTAEVRCACGHLATDCSCSKKETVQNVPQN